MAEHEHKNFLGSYPEALLIALLTAGMYWFSFVHEVAYLTSYGLPIHLLQVNLQTMFLVAPIMTAIGIPIILLAGVLHSRSLLVQRKGTAFLCFCFSTVLHNKL